MFFYATAALASAAYLLLTFLAPDTGNAFSLNPGELFFLKATVVVPYVATWAFAAYGLSTLGEYVGRADKENATVRELLRCFRNGLLWIAAGTVCAAVIGAVKPFAMGNAPLTSLLTVVTNYLYVFPQLVGFLIVYCGVLRLRRSPELAGHERSGSLLSVLLTAAIAFVYVYLIASNQTRQFSADPAVPATYGLPDALIFLTIVAPMIMSWWLGLFSAFVMSDLVPYLANERIFRGISRLLYGIWSIVFASIVIQALLSIGTARLYAVGLGPLLLVIYIFVLLQGLGYFWIASGTKALRRPLRANGA